MTESPQYVIVDNPDNGSPCPVCKKPVYLTRDGWRDEQGRGTHLSPALDPPTK